MNQQMNPLRFGLVALMFLSLVHCTKKDDKSTQGSNSTISSTVTSNLQIIQNGFTPNSMAASSTTLQSANFKLMTSGSGPCVDLDFFQCQSVLVRLYFSIGKSLVGTAAQMVGAVGTQLGQLADGASGTVNTDEGGTLTYSKTSDSIFSILAKNASGTSGLYLSVNDSIYTLQVDIPTMDSTETDAVKLGMTVTFTSANAWTADLFMINTTCDATDPGAPERIKINITRADTVWTGKAMLYHPHWGGDSATCSTSNAIAMYTDFVGSDLATKGALYLIPGASSNVSAIETDYPFTNYCTNFSSTCGNGVGQIPSSMTANYPNPFCSTEPGVTPTFNSNCSTVDTNVSSASYSAASLWLTPSALSAATITLPSSLE